MGTRATADAFREGSSIREYLGVVQRRRWVVIQAVVLVPLAMLFFSLRQTPLYQASASVLVHLQSPVQTITGTADPSAGANPDRVLQTQAQLATNPLVARRVLRAAGLHDVSALDFLQRSSVQAQLNSDLLIFSVTDANAARAIRLATLYGQQFAIYRRELDTAALKRADQELKKRIKTLEAAGQTASTQLQALLDQEQKLGTAITLQTSNVSLVKTPLGATKVRPKPLQSGVLGLALGIVLGVALAFLWEALDTRVRTTEEIERALGIPLLARIPAPPRWLQRRRRLIMLTEPHSIHAEPYRVLRTNLDFFNLEHAARTIMVTSAVAEEGKSTTVANLAVALSRAGQRVVLVDLDLRRPSISKFFGFGDRVGLTDVALGRAQLAPVSVEHEVDDESGAQGNLEVLTTGTLPRDTGEFVGGVELTRVIEQLRERADIVLIDSPPLFAAADAIALAAKVDGIIVLTRLGVVRRRMLEELRRVLGSIPAAKLGFVVTEADIEPHSKYGYGYGYGYEQESDVRREHGRNRSHRRQRDRRGSR
jgi:capsular exopolysaccharide synthesis family protein